MRSLEKSKNWALRGVGIAILSACSVRGGRGRPGASRDDRGATAVEYCIMVAFIALVIIASVTVFGQNVIRLFQVPSSAL
ncbi:Flp family type IVb pilin [Pedococcus sp. 5OH_020]|uniref:Flp family type IVb pilin n=1 Tax=Pedococcus sp. 5OH_020 TaxID=2989814 RepID=UPI0022E9C117|nr:Flp family type IVb pilin [Pedococcus sp. 5OH_020]